jgi:hypothetical protein
MMERFWTKVMKSDGCWLYNGCKTRFGYGKFAITGGWVLAHRISWLLSFGNIPEDSCVLHRCDNPGCVNPDHLFLGTQLDNIYDMVFKGRNKTLIPDSTVTIIKDEILAGIISRRGIARKYNVSPSYITKLAHGDLRSIGGAL